MKEKCRYDILKEVHQVNFKEGHLDFIEYGKVRGEWYERIRKISKAIKD